MNNASTKPSWWRTIFQRLNVIFGPKRLSLKAGIEKIYESDITIPEEFLFENIIEIYKKYTPKSNSRTNTIIINKETLEEFEDEKLAQKLEFANIWRKCASRKSFGRN